MKSKSPKRCCKHLIEKPDDYFAWFTGVGKEYYWICSDCAAQFEKLESNAMCDATAEAIELIEEEWWEGIVGSAEVKVDLQEIVFDQVPCEIPFSTGSSKNGKVSTSPVIDVQPSNSCDGWVFLLATGELLLWSEQEGQEDRICAIELGFDLDGETGLRLSSQNRFAAVFQTSGSLASVVDLQTGDMTVQISRGDYRPENSHFPIAFFQRQDRCFVVAATAWNRLDIFDASDGSLLTSREIDEQLANGRARCSNYFHGRLHVSPDQQWIVDDGWVWQPAGIARAWNLDAWLANPWETEDGPSLQRVAFRAYYWDGAMCFVGNDQLCHYGYGEDDEWLLPAAVQVNVRSGEKVGWFPGPHARPSLAWPPKKQAPSFFYDQDQDWLVSISDAQGTAIWDLASGTLLHKDPSLVPIRFHPRSRTLLATSESGFGLWRLP